MAQPGWLADANPLTVAVRTVGSTIYVELRGEADIWGWTRLRAVADAITEGDPPKRVVFDLAGLRFACIRSLRLLVDIADRFAAAGIEVSFSEIQPNIARIAVLAEVQLAQRAASPVEARG